MHSDDVLYGEDAITFLEALWGEGYLSPGGPAEVARLLDGVDLVGKAVVDIGCGAGGITIALARDYGAAKVIGLDVEEPVCGLSRKRAAEAGLADRVEILQVEPGPMPLADGSVDIVFSKDSIVHIPDKENLTRDAFRVLKPGGMFVASDWLISHDGDPSPEMAAYIAQEDLNFGMASPDRYRKALVAAGFMDITLKNRNPWYRDIARDELMRLEKLDRARFESVLPPGELDAQVATWRAMLVVLESGEHCPHHFRATKPNAS